jgi:hypothetical protein
LEKAAFLGGLLHDVGKYAAVFQQRLEGADIRVDHSTAGARLLLGDLATGLDKGIAKLVALESVATASPRRFLGIRAADPDDRCQMGRPRDS